MSCDEEKRAFFFGVVIESHHAPCRYVHLQNTNCFNQLQFGKCELEIRI
jgi:hypothetical protein